MPSDIELRIRRTERELTIAERKAEEADREIDKLLLAYLTMRQMNENSNYGTPSCSATVLITVRCLSGYAGVTVTVTKGATSYSLVTNGSGQALFTLTDPGVWSYSTSGGGIPATSGTFTFACVNMTKIIEVANYYSHTVSGNVKACNDVPAVGATITVKNPGGTTVATATTDSSGNYSATWFGTGESGHTAYCNYNPVSPARFVQSTTAFVNTSLCADTTDTRNFNMSAFVHDDYVCDPCGGGIPIKKVLTCTPPFGSPFLMTWGTGGAGWTGFDDPTYTALEYCASDSVTKTSRVYWQFSGVVAGVANPPCSINYTSAVCGAPPPCTIGDNDDQLKHPFPVITCAQVVAVYANTPASHTNYPFVATWNMPATLGTIATGTCTLTE